MSLNRFIQGGRLTDRHKNKVNTKETLKRLNQIAKEKVNGTSNSESTINKNILYKKYNG